MNTQPSPSTEPHEDAALSQAVRALRSDQTDPTPVWKADILATAAKAREGQSPTLRNHPMPRWLLAALLPLWLATLFFTMTEPDTTSFTPSSAELSRIQHLGSPSPVPTDPPLPYLDLPALVRGTVPKGYFTTLQHLDALDMPPPSYAEIP